MTLLAAAVAAPVVVLAVVGFFFWRWYKKPRTRYECKRCGKEQDDGVLKAADDGNYKCADCGFTIILTLTLTPNSINLTRNPNPFAEA